MGVQSTLIGLALLFLVVLAIAAGIAAIHIWEGKNETESGSNT